jgi:hypothetical protein
MFHLTSFDMQRIGAKSATIILFASLTLLPREPSQASPQQPQASTGCFILHVYKDSKRLPPPQSIRLYSASKQWDLGESDGHFCIPKETTGESLLDLTFRIGHDRFSLYSVPVRRYSGAWNLYFGGKEFARLHGLPKTSKASTSCMVEFDDGEPGTGMVVSPCRQRESVKAPVRSRG